jgi:glutathionylspermidine synthase
MKREIVPHRPNWKTIHESLRFNETSSIQKPETWDESAVWQEGACYRFSKKQVDMLAAAAKNLHDMSMTVLDELIRTGNYGAFMNVPDKMIPYIEKSWKRGDRALYGRFDLAYDGANPPKMLEYNADNCGSLLEASSLQFAWAKALNKPMQFTNIEPDLVTELQAMRLERGMRHLHLAADYTKPEESLTIDHVAHAAQQAGVQITRLNLADVGWNKEALEFRDTDEKKIETLFMAYAWDALVQDEFCQNLIDYDPAKFIEPSWRMLLTSKAFMTLLWNEFPEHENLLPTYNTPEHLGAHFVRKPVWGYQGHGISIHKDDTHVREEAIRANTFDHVYQDYAPLPEFEGHRALTQIWMVGNTVSGIGMLEDTKEIVGSQARFVPHYIY